MQDNLIVFPDPPAGDNTSLAMPASLLPLTTLIGRAQEVQTLKASLLRSDVRLLTLTGPAGVGKTRLALEVAHDLLPAFVDGVSLIFLAPLNDPSFVLPALARGLGLTEHSSLPTLELLKVTLRDRRQLLVLDNFEHVLEVAPLLVELLEVCPGLQLLTTSREALRLRGEYQYAVSPLVLPDPFHLPDVQSLAQVPAITLFLQRAQAIRPDFHMTPDNAATIAEICLRLDGLPLAIELAAARVKVLSPQALLAGLEHRLHLLTLGPRDLPERHQTLRKTIGWSYALLTPLEQQLFRRLSVFVGGCTFAAVAALSPVPAESTAQVLDILTALVDKSLVQQQSSAAGAPRFTLLETIREFGLECLTESGELAATRQTHALYYLALAEEAKPALRGAGQGPWLIRLEQERENLRSAMRWSLEQAELGQNADIALRLGDALEQFWMTRGPYSEGRVFLEGVLAKSADVAPEVQAQALIAAANLVSMQGNYAQGEFFARKGLVLCQQLGDKPGVARSLFQLGRLCYKKGNLTEARLYMEQLVEVRRQTHDTRWIATALRSLAYVLGDQGEYARAIALCEESIRALRELGYQEALAQSLFEWAWIVFVSQADLAGVQSAVAEGLALARELDSSELIADFLLLSGCMAFYQGDASSANHLFEESLALYGKVGARRETALPLTLLGKVAASLGDHVTAQAFFKQCLALERDVGSTKIVPFCLEGLADSLAAQGSLTEAARLWGAADALRAAMGMPLWPVDHANYKRSIAAVRSQLGEKDFTSAWAEGSKITPEQVLIVPAEATVAVPLQPSPPAEKSPAAYPDGLTAREVEVLRLVAQGLSNAQIAERLIISLLTVKAHMRSIYNKLGINSRSAATRYAIEHHLT